MSKVSYRNWRGPDDWPAIADVITAEYRADGLPYIKTSEELAADHRPNMVPGRDILLAAIETAGDGDAGDPSASPSRIVGVIIGSFAVRDGVLSLDTEGAVHPDARRRGIGGELLTRMQEHLVNRTRDLEPDRKHVFASWIQNGNAGAVALFERDGYRPVRYGYEMIRRGLDGNEALPDVSLPMGIELRPGSVAQLDVIHAAEDEAFRDHPGHRDWTPEDRQSALAHPEFDPTAWVVAWDGDQVAGVVENWIHRHENERLGIRNAWLDRVSVRRPWRQRGLARAMIAASFRVLRERGIEAACLGVDVNNPSGALRLYESLGFVPMQSARLVVRDAPGAGPDA